MPTVTRHLGLIVILVLVVGHTSFAVHAASHDVVDIAECQICISYGDTSAALGGESACDVPAMPAAGVGAADEHPLLPCDAMDVRQRGPPQAA
ncbi:MAG: hypothetical protein KJP17_08070 [Gammaproteobacteria bacterium]|nr:hypothetical protein [Gammaproteobacteria bacterium]